MRNSTLVTGLLLAAASTATWAYQPLVTDDTGTQGEGGNQLEFAFNRDRATQAGITEITRILPLTYSRGLSEALDIFVGINHTRRSSSAPGAKVYSGSGNPSMGLKWRFYENAASKTSFALKPELGLPIDEDKEAVGLGSGRTSYSLTTILTQETAFGAVLANLAAGRTLYRNTAINPDTSTIRASIAPVWQVNEEWKLALDMGSETQHAAGHKTRAEFLEIGVVFSPTKGLDFAFGILRRTDHTSPSTIINAISTGVTWRFK
jgi:hypothetical protein